MSTLYILGPFKDNGLWNKAYKSLEEECHHFVSRDLLMEECSLGKRKHGKTNMDACNQNNYVHILLYYCLDYKKDNVHEKIV